MQNKMAVWNVFQTAVPLGFGSLLEYGEVSRTLFNLIPTGSELDEVVLMRFF